MEVFIRQKSHEKGFVMLNFILQKMKHQAMSNVIGKMVIGWGLDIEGVTTQRAQRKGIFDMRIRTWMLSVWLMTRLKLIHEVRAITVWKKNYLVASTESKMRYKVTGSKGEGTLVSCSDHATQTEVMDAVQLPSPGGPQRTQTQIEGPALNSGDPQATVGGADDEAAYALPPLASPRSRSTDKLVLDCTGGSGSENTESRSRTPSPEKSRSKGHKARKAAKDPSKEFESSPLVGIITAHLVQLCGDDLQNEDAEKVAKVLLCHGLWRSVTLEDKVRGATEWGVLLEEAALSKQGLLLLRNVASGLVDKFRQEETAMLALCLQTATSGCLSPEDTMHLAARLVAEGLSSSSMIGAAGCSRGIQNSGIGKWEALLLKCGMGGEVMNILIANSSAIAENLESLEDERRFGPDL